MLKGVFVLKIHIIRQGDTLFKLAKQYGVDLEDVIKSNPQLASPDTIMPGMKIMIPTNEKQINLVMEDVNADTNQVEIKRPMEAVEDDVLPNRKMEDMPRYPINDEQEKKLNLTMKEKAEKAKEEIAYTREEGGVRELPISERPLMSPPQHRFQQKVCCHCQQPLKDKNHAF